MSTAYLKGCHRVSCLVTKSPSFREIVGARVSQEIEALAAQDHTSRAYVKQLMGTLKHGRIYDVVRADIVFFGRTENNLKEFRFLLRVLEEQGVTCSYKFFLDDFISVRRKVPSIAKGAMEGIAQDVVQWLHDTEGLTGAHLFQHMQYTSTYHDVLSSYNGKEHLLPRIAVVANDHSPSQVGFAMAMESLGVPVIYIQHAEVSDAFPPLDFTASVLRNRVSLDTYQGVGPIKGRTFVVSRSFEAAAFREVLQKTSGEAIVGIYPTSRCDTAIIRKVVDSLKRNPAVKDYFVKPHPNSATKFSREEEKYFQIRTAVPDDGHIAIVGNSSVVIDLLSRGVPVYQLFALDKVMPDYYGFVKTGLAPAIEYSDLEKAFWARNFYDEGWLERAARFDPSIEDDQVQARRELAHFLQDTLAQHAPDSSVYPATRLPLSIRMKMKIKYALQKTLRPVARRFPRVVEQLGALLSSSVPESYRRMIPTKRLQTSTVQAVEIVLDHASERARLADLLLSSRNDAELRIGVMSWFDKRWQDRDARAMEVVRANLRQDGVASGDTWLRLKTHDIAAVPLKEDEATEIVQEINAVRDSPLRAKYEELALRVFIKNGLLKQFFDLLYASPVYRLETLSGSFKVEIARLLSRSELNEQRLTKEEFLQSVSQFERKKIYAAGTTQFITKEHWDHERLEKDFAALTHPELAETFRRIVAPAYEQLRPRMRYMDIRTDARQAEELRGVILGAIGAKKPFSLVRLGDGEAYLFNSDGLPFTEDDRCFRERHWWGINLEAGQREALVHRSREAVAEADIVGVPSIHRFFRDFSERSSNLLATTANRGIVTSVLGAREVLSTNALLTEDRANHIVFRRDCLRQYIEAAERVIFISSVKASRVLELSGDLGEVQVIEIPTHAKTRDNHLYADHPDVLPLVMHELEERLRGMVRPGDLVLVGAGVAGKSFIGIAKKQGAVALDVGGMIEVFFGIPNGPLF